MGDVKIVTFGKYRGKPVDSLVADDKYCQWLAAQPKTLARYPWLETLLATGETEQTPVHNKLQARFTEDAFVETFLDLFDDHAFWQTVAKKEYQAWKFSALENLSNFQERYGPHYQTWDETWATRNYTGSEREKNEAARNWMIMERLLSYREDQYWRQIRHVEYEVKGADVVIAWRIMGPLGVLRDDSRTWDDRRIEYRTAIECKPGMADDYPAVLRQMKRNDCNVLLIGDYGYTGEGASFEQVEKMFTASDIRIIFLSELPGEST